MPETNAQQGSAAERMGRRKEIIGKVVSNRMQKTIVVQEGASVLWPGSFESEKVLCA